MIKRRSADRAEWARVTKRRFAHITIEEPHFTGMVTLLCIDAMTSPLWIQSETYELCVADGGYHWLQHFPAGANFGVTTMFNAQGEVIQWYIDIVKTHGVDERGIPWWDDLYLDIVVMPNGTSEILDGDELDDALRDGLITQDEHELAWDVARSIHSQIEQRRFPLLARSVAHRELLLSRLG